MAKIKTAKVTTKPQTKAKPQPNNYLASEFVQDIPDLAMLQPVMTPLPIIHGNEPANVWFTPPVNQPVFSPPSSPYPIDMPLEKPADLTLTVDTPVTTGGIQTLAQPGIFTGVQPSGPVQPTTIMDMQTPVVAPTNKNMWSWIIIIIIAAIVIYMLAKNKK